MYGKAQWVQCLATLHASNYGKIVQWALALGLQFVGTDFGVMVLLGDLITWSGLAGLENTVRLELDMAGSC